MANKDKKADPAEAEVAPAPVEDQPVPSKGDASYETPSGYALAKAGDDPDKYARLKREKRWGP